jgi:hypothetical protein
VTISRIAVMYPRGGVTGGPEALHQLVDALRAAGVHAGLVAHPATTGRPRSKAYEMYDAPEFTSVLDAPDEVVIAPEVYVRDLGRLRKSRKVCWWLSIDNSPFFRAERRFADWRHGIADSLSILDAHSLIFWTVRALTAWRSRLQKMDHVAQSRYAQVYLAEHLGVSADPLSDYLAGLTPTNRSPKSALQTPRVAFNPAKGARHIKRVQAGLRRPVEWLPIAGLSREEVLGVLQSADVYVDLGAHPGKDRIPREAAAMGAVAIVAKRGSGCFYEDVPIPDQHKVSTTDDFAQNAVDVLNGVLDGLPRAFELQAPYRSDIADQERTFRSEVAALVSRLTPDEDVQCRGP